MITQIPGGEIEFLVVQRVIGDVHLAVDPAQRAIVLQQGNGVVIKPGRPALEEGSDYHYLLFLGDSSKPLCGRAGDRLRQVEELGIFALAEILRAE